MAVATIDPEGYTSEVRTSRRRRTCETGQCTIRPGDRYVRHAATPRSEYADGSGRWHWMYECAPCHLRRKRGDQVG